MTFWLLVALWGASPADGPARERLDAAVAELNSGRRETGIRHLEEILRSHSKYRQAMEILAGQYLETGRRREAEELARRCLALHPHSSRCHTARGRALLEQGRLAQAAKSLRRAVEKDSADPQARLYLGLAYLQQGDFRRAEVELNHALAYRKPAGLAVVHIYLSAVYENQQRYADAAQQLEWYLQEQPQAGNRETLRKKIEGLRGRGGNR